MEGGGQRPGPTARCSGLWSLQETLRAVPRPVREMLINCLINIRWTMAPRGASGLSAAGQTPRGRSGAASQPQKGPRVHRTGFLVAVDGGSSGATIRSHLFLAVALQAPRKSPEAVAEAEACAPQAASRVSRQSTT